jgi:Zn-dependent M28 family amino/carboxypeptidase
MDTRSPVYPPHAFISTTILEEILGSKKTKYIKRRDRIRKKGKSKSLCMDTNLSYYQDKKAESITAENVMGYVEGSDRAKKNELIIVSAHYDHLGKRGDGIYNGADDNASGSSTVMELARLFKMAKDNGIGAARSVLFLLVSGEEKGLLGSEYYAENPVFPLEQTVANVNVDMIGRRDKKHQDNPAYIYVIGADRLSSELHNINEEMNRNHTHLELDYTYNDDNDPNRYYYRSDHYNFAKKGIPAIFYFSGVHQDYHKTTDTTDKIEFQKIGPVARLIFHTTWELANRSERIVVDKKSE